MLHCLNKESQFHTSMGAKGGWTDKNMHLFESEFFDLCLGRTTLVPQACGAALDSKWVHLIFDHLVLKEPGDVGPTTWHQDMPHWPFRGKQMSSVWIAFD